MANLIPLGYTGFCAVHPGEFADSYPEATFDDTDTLNRVNRWVNHGIIWEETFQGERWAIWPPSGPCHDYAITKRHEMIKAGAPPGAFALLYCLHEGNGHLVLEVKTKNGIVVMDNVDDVIYPLSDINYEIVSTQKFSSPKDWL